MQKWIKNKGKKNMNERSGFFKIQFFRHVVTELLVTEQVYVEELRTIINVNTYIFSFSKVYSDY
jgi:hypothetical protein